MASRAFRRARERLRAAVLRGGRGPPRAGPAASSAGPGRVRIDGQELDPEIQLLLRLLRLSRRPSFEDAARVAEAREEIRREAEITRERTTLPLASVGGHVAVPGAGRRSRRAPLRRPSGSRRPAPLLVYLHGGGWVVGDLDTHDQPCRFLAREAGVRVLSVDYRLRARAPVPGRGRGRRRRRCAMRSQQAERLGADPARIAVGGDSAGGNLAAAAARLLAPTAARRPPSSC